MLDEEHEELPTRDDNHYILGRVSRHNVVIAGLPEGYHGTVRATRVLTDLRSTFPAVDRCLLVGIGGGFPNPPLQDIRLGDVIVGQRVKTYDEGKQTDDGAFQMTGDSMRPSDNMGTALIILRARHEHASAAADITKTVQSSFTATREYQRPRMEDILFQSNYRHPASSYNCRRCDKNMAVPRPKRSSNHPMVHYGTIASGNTLIKSSSLRDRLAQELNVVCAEMEAAGLMGMMPTLVVRGVSDYADSHKMDSYQKHAAANAAAFAKEFLKVLKPSRLSGAQEAEPTVSVSDKFNKGN
jgi:nucleoside phosphorylase